jgi:hypothetical protein
MNNEHRIRRHPARRDLVAHAETLLDGSSPLSAAIAAHLAQCDACAEEVNSIHASLEFATAAQPLEPSTDFTAQILIDANRERAKDKPPHTSILSVASRALAYASALLIITTLYFGVALHRPLPTTEAHNLDNPLSHAEFTPSLKAVHEIIGEIQTLSAAVRFAPVEEQTPREQEQRRAVDAIDQDIEAALKALERNPGSLHANRTILASLQRQAETLRALYVERTL